MSSAKLGKLSRNVLEGELEKDFTAINLKSNSFTSILNAERTSLARIGQIDDDE